MICDILGWENWKQEGLIFKFRINYTLIWKWVNNYVIDYFDIFKLFNLEENWIIFVKTTVNNILPNITFIRIADNSGMCRGMYPRKYEILSCLVC